MKVWCTKYNNYCTTSCMCFLKRDYLKSDGGPSSYYDFDPGFKTANDIMEWLADKRWLGDALHMKDIFKACFRWGVKEGTDKAYDASKIVYSGLRLYMKYKGKEETRKMLNRLIEDKQFQV